MGSAVSIWRSTRRKKLTAVSLITRQPSSSSSRVELFRQYRGSGVMEIHERITKTIEEVSLRSERILFREASTLVHSRRP